MSTLPASFPPLPALVYRDRLSAIRERLHDLERSAPPGHAAGLYDALEAVEDELLSLGWSCPEGELTPHDLSVLAALGCPA